MFLARLNSSRSRSFESGVTLFADGWVFLERTRIPSRFQFTRHLIEFVRVETNQCVGSNPNMIWMRQTCGQRSSMSAGSKRRALKNSFVVRICYVFLLSQCRGDLDVGLCTLWTLAYGETLRNEKFRFFLRQRTFFLRCRGIRVCCSDARVYCSDVRMCCSDARVCCSNIRVCNSDVRVCCSDVRSCCSDVRVCCSGCIHSHLLSPLALNLRAMLSCAAVLCKRVASSSLP